MTDPAQPAQTAHDILNAQRDALHNSGYPKQVPVVFSGEKMAYFKLWLVNALLSIITLGIYSAWAKVRNTQYLYGHTQIDGHRFSFLAKPLNILIGRIIAGVLFVLYAVISGLNPILSLLMPLGLLLVSPWLINQGLRFTMRNTAYRNVRFNFHGGYGGAFVHFILLPVVGALTAWLAMPWVLKKIHQYIYKNTSFGGKSASLNTSTGYYYKAALIALAVGLVFGVIGYALTVGSNLMYNVQMGYWSVAMILPFVMAFYLIALGVMGGVFYSQIFNHLVNNLQIDGVVSFKAGLNSADYCKLSLSNSLLLIVTLGLAWPVTLIRKNALLAQSTEVALQPGIETLINTVTEEEGAFGEEAAGAFDVDLSLT